ncbi:MAG: lipase family protein [Gammaproteobacteria bacterium]|nr:lipase family protein [Gammaproteobacteria bacterium]
MPKHNVLLNAIALAYGGCAYNFDNHKDPYGYGERGVTEGYAVPTWYKVRDVFKSQNRIMTQSRYQREGFCPWEPVTLMRAAKTPLSPPPPANGIPFPVNVRVTATEKWSYDLEPEFMEGMNAHYDIYALTGKIGSESKQVFAVMGFIALPKPTAPASASVYIAFKGTQGGLGAGSVIAGFFGNANPEWNSNCQFSLTEFPGLTGKVHKGFYNVYAPMMHEQIVSFIEERKLGNRKIYVSGHSLGAALASICALSLAKEGYEHVRLFALATPALGDAELMRNFDRCLPSEFRRAFHLEGDPVRNVPPLSGMVQFPSEDLSPYFTGKIKQESDKHYFEAIRAALLQKLGSLGKIMPLITCKTIHKDMQDRELASHMTTHDGRPLTITGHALPPTTHVIGGGINDDEGQLHPIVKPWWSLS